MKRPYVYVFNKEKAKECYISTNSFFIATCFYRTGSFRMSVYQKFCRVSNWISPVQMGWMIKWYVNFLKISLLVKKVCFSFNIWLDDFWLIWLIKFSWRFFLMPSVSVRLVVCIVETIKWQLFCKKPEKHTFSLCAKNLEPLFFVAFFAAFF